MVDDKSRAGAARGTSSRAWVLVFKLIFSDLAAFLRADDGGNSQ